MRPERPIARGTVSNEGVARLLFLTRQVRDDQRFIQASNSNRVTYHLDLDVVYRYLNPHSPASLRYMRIFEDINRSQPVESSVRDLLYSSMAMTAREIFHGRYSESIVLSLPYRRALQRALPDLVDFRPAIESLDHQLMAEIMKEMASLARSLEEGRPLRPSDVLRVRDRAPEIAKLALFHGQHPITRLASIAKKLLSSPTVGPSTAQLRNSQEYGYLYPRIHEARSYLVRQGLRTEENLQSNINDDVDALIMALAAARTNPQSERVLFLTGDSGIHQIVDLAYVNGDARRLGWPSYNFVRRPVQLSDFLQGAPDTYDYDQTNEFIVASLNLHFDRAFSFGENRDANLYNQMYNWTGRKLADAPGPIRAFDSLDTNRFLRSGLALIEKSLDGARKQSLLSYAKELLSQINRSTIEPIESDLIGNVAVVLERATHDVMVSAINSYKTNVMVLAPFISEDKFRSSQSIVHTVELILSAAKNAVPADADDQRLLMRMPYFPRFISDIGNDLGIAAGEESAVRFLSDLAQLPPVDAFIFNIYFLSLLNEWSAAADQAKIAIGVATAQSWPADQRAEVCYLRAVCLRHTDSPPPDVLAEASQQLEIATKLVSNEPRFLAEQAALLLARFAHHRHYDDDYDAEDPRVLGKALALLRHSEKAAEGKLDNSERSLRYRTQLYANLVMLGVFRVIYDTPAILQDSEYSEAVKNLSRAVLARGGSERVSYLVRFVLLAGELIMKGPPEHKIMDANRLRDIEDMELFHREKIIEYDMAKIRLFLNHARLLRDQGKPIEF